MGRRDTTNCVRKNKKRSMTLLEIIIIIIIIGILAALGLPNFEKGIERARVKEAIVNLRLIAAAERNFRLETGSYYSSGNIDDINTNLKLQLDEDNWDYSISSTGANNFTATADRQGTGTYSSCEYAIGQDDDEPAPSGGSCP